jgi:hypothetical protein
MIIIDIRSFIFFYPWNGGIYTYIIRPTGFFLLSEQEFWLIVYFDAELFWSKAVLSNSHDEATANEREKR